MGEWSTVAHPRPAPHGPIEAITPRLHIVRGSMRMNPIVRISRNMAILRDDDGLTLVNPIRLDEAGERALEALGTVKRLVRLGAMHGVDDPYCKQRFDAEFWSQPDGTSYSEPAIDQPLADGETLPFPDAELFCFKGTCEPEAALLVRDTPNVLLTCDAIQHYGDYSFNNLPARMAMPYIGFPKTTVLGPIWLKRMTPPGASLRGEFERLLGMDFEALIGAHGTFLGSGARAAVRRAVERAFGA